MAAQVGYGKARKANFREDNPAAADCFLFVTATTCGDQLQSLKSSPAFGISVGYRISPMFRAELSYQRRSGFDLSGTDAAGTEFDPPVESDVVLFTGVFDIPYKIDGWIQPYVGGGVGRAKNKMEALRWNDPACCSGVLNDGGSNTSTAWQLTLGAAFTLSSKWVLDVAFRYTDLGKFKKARGTDQSGNFNGTGTTTSATGKLRVDEILLGMRYEFF